MSPSELFSALGQQPFEPFRIVLTDGASYDIYHPELMAVSIRTATVGIPSAPGQMVADRTVKIDLLHIVRMEPLEVPTKPSKNGPAS